MKYFLIAGEASGDLHAAHLMHAIKKNDPQAQFAFLGGDLMQAEGGTLVRHYRDMAFMGFVEVIRNAGKVLKNFEMCKTAMKAFMPDAVILIDYPGFNLKMARYAKVELCLPVHYYISPKIWAWKTYRIRQIKRYVDRLYSILPFEVSFYAGYDYWIDYVGNPSVDELLGKEHPAIPLSAFTAKHNLPNKPIIALLAGSRQHEVTANLPTMMQAAAAFPDHQAIIAGAPGLDPAFYQEIIGNRPVRVLFGETYAILRQAQAALVTSGTATLETALLNVPQAVCYQAAGGRFTYLLFSHLLKVKYISLVNLIADKTVVKELVAHLFSEKSLKDELHRLLFDAPYRARMQAEYALIRQSLGEPGAPERTAKLIIDSLCH